MKIYTKIVMDWDTGKILDSESYEYDGPIAKLDRAAQQAARQANTTAATTAGQYGAGAGAIAGRLLPFEMNQMTNPQGESPRDIQAQITNALAGAGGGTSGLFGAAKQYAGATRSPMGFSSALDEAARQRAKAAAGAATGVAAENAKVKLGQQSDAAKALAGLYGEDVRGQLESQGQQAQDINALTQAGKSGWLQNLNDTIATITGGAKAAFPKGLQG